VTTVLSQYLDNIRDNLKLDLASEREVIGELETHIEDRLEEMRKAGLSEEEAANTCIKLLGSAKLVARKIYEAHSQGTWKQALLASMPHLLFGMLFALNWWQGIVWLIIALGLVISVTAYAKSRRRPVWFFPWLGYSLLPVVVAGLFLLYLPKGWSWLAILVYLTLALWWVVSITVKTLRRDWLYAALMLMPIPIIIGWFLAVGQEGRLLEMDFENIHYFAPRIGLSFLALAITAVAFIRLRQRWLKIILLHTSGILTLTMVTIYAQGRLSLPVFSILAVIMLGLLVSPALVERRIRHGKKRLIT